MTTERDFNRMLDGWFADGTVEPPETIVGAIATRIHGQAQRPAWRVAWGPAATGGSSRSLALIAAAVLVGGIGVALVAGSRPVIDPTPTPGASLSIAPTPTATMAATPEACLRFPCLGPLSEGTHRGFDFLPQLWFTVPEGWALVRDDIDVLALRRDAVGGRPSIDLELLRGVAASAHDAGCGAVPAGDGSLSADAWAELLATHPDLEPTVPESFTLDGRRGRRVTLTLRPNRAPVCVGTPDASGPVGNGLIMTKNKVTTLWIADVADHVVVITLETASSMDDHLEEVTTVESIIASIRFGLSVTADEHRPVGAGPYRTTAFQNPLRLDIAAPDTWWASEGPGFVVLSHGMADGSENVEIVTNVYPVPRGPDGCMSRVPEASDPHSAADLLASLRAIRGLDVRAEPISLGGLAGWSVELAEMPTWQACGGPELAEDGESAYVVRWPDGGTITVGSYSFKVFDGHDGRTIVVEERGASAAFLEDAARILESFAFRP